MTCIRSLTIEGYAAFEYQKIFRNALKTAHLNLSEYFDQEKIAQERILLEMPPIQVEGFLTARRRGSKIVFGRKLFAHYENVINFDTCKQSISSYL